MSFVVLFGRRRRRRLSVKLYSGKIMTLLYFFLIDAEKATLHIDHMYVNILLTLILCFVYIFTSTNTTKQVDEV